MSSKTSKSKTAKLPTSPVDGLGGVLDYSQLFQLLPQRYIILRVDDPKFSFVEVNTAHSAMTGVSRENMLGRSFFEVFPDVSERFKTTGYSELAEAFRTVIRTKKPYVLSVFRYDIADADGNFIERYWRQAHYPLMAKDDTVQYILQSSHDVTEELLAENKLRETQAQLEDALNIGKVGSWLWNVDRNLVVVNRTLSELLGIDIAKGQKGLSIKAFTDTIHPEDRSRVLADINNSITKNRSFESEFRNVSTDGTVHWVLARGRLEIDKNGRSASFPGVIVDITERHNFEAQIEKARLREELNQREAELLIRRNEELEMISRTKDEFVALASHQLRTPATAVKQYVGMVLQGYVGNISDTQTEMLDKAFESNERQIEIINQILNAARVDTGRLVLTLAPLNVQTQLQGIVEDMRPSIEQKGHTFTAALGHKSAEIYGDNGYLRMAIENVIHNASIYTEAPGHIDVTLKKTAKNILVIISDNGVGIRKADMHKLYTKFSRIHNPLSVQAGGSGIGLYLTAEILRLHGGNIAVESKIHKGTTFTLSLPLLHHGEK